MTRLGFEPRSPFGDQEMLAHFVLRFNLNLTPWTNSAILPTVGGTGPNWFHKVESNYLANRVM